MAFGYSAFKGNGAKQIPLSFELVAPPRVLFKNECIWPNSKHEGSQLGVSYHLHPMERCGFVMDDSCWLLSASQKWIILEEQETDPGLLSAAELFFSGWQPATCCATILFLSWSSSDKLNSSDDGGRSGSSNGRRCPSDSHLLGEPEDPAESSGDGSGSA